jgi:hypothetical protein
MIAKSISCTFDREAVWQKVRYRSSIVLDMNCWINMGEDKFPSASRIKATLRKAVSDGLVFCPLSFGLICELYRQAEDSRLRIGTLMDELSLNVSYASREEIFAWEVERAVRILANAGPIELSRYELYVPVLAYLTSRFQLEFPEGFPQEHVEDFTKKFKDRVESLTFTELLTMRAARNLDKIFDYMKEIPPPKYSEASKDTWEKVKGDKQKILRIEAQSAFEQYIKPAIKKLPPAVMAKFWEYTLAVPKDKYGGFLGELLKSLPAIYNHVELMAAVTQQPSRQDRINHFFDNEIMPVPLAYASVFVAQDKGIRDTLRNRTEILKRNTCRYCFDLDELDDWLKAEGLA